MRRRCCLLASVAAGLALAAPALAYDPATTHAGLTQRAVEASRLHQVLARKLGRPLGLLEPLRLSGAPEANLSSRLAALDPAGGYRPGPDGANPAASWVVAGSVLAKTPPERGRHHFLDARDRAGLHDNPGLSGTAHATRLLFSGGTSVRGLATGTAFALEGKPSIEWIWSDNDLGIPVFLEGWERAVSLPSPAERETALVRALLALGGVAAVLEDAGDPAFVRNDFRGALLGGKHGSRYEQYTSERYGRVAVPPAKPPVSRPDIGSFFTAPDRKGLADRTQRRFFSEGNLPENVHLDRVPDAERVLPADPRHRGRGDTDLDRVPDAERVLRAVRESLRYPSPGVTKLLLDPVPRPRYLVLEGRRTLGYRVKNGTLHFFLDDAVHADAARWLLPEIGGYVAGLIDHLLRAGLDIALDQGRATVTLSGPVDQGGALHVYSEDASGQRRELDGVLALAPGAAVTVEVPAGARRLAAVLRGQDKGGPFVAAAEIALP